MRRRSGATFLSSETKTGTLPSGSIIRNSVVAAEKVSIFRSLATVPAGFATIRARKLCQVVILPFGFARMALGRAFAIEWQGVFERNVFQRFNRDDLSG